MGYIDKYFEDHSLQLEEINGRLILFSVFRTNWTQEAIVANRGTALVKAWAIVQRREELKIRQNQLLDT